MSGTYTTSSSLSSGQTSSGLMVGSREELTVFSGASIVNATVYGEDVLSGGSATGTILQTSGFERVMAGGSSVDAMVRDGFQVVSSGGVASGAAVDIHGTQLVSGGTAIATSVSGRGVEDVYSGGFTSDTQLGSSGFETVYAGGTASGTQVASGGVLTISSGGVSEDAMISSGGTVVVGSGGLAQGASGSGLLPIQGGEQITPGGTLLVESGGVVTGDLQVYGQLSSGGNQISAGVEILDGGSAVDATVSVGLLEVFSGATLSDTTIGYGGTLVLASGATSAGASFSGGELVADGKTFNIENDVLTASSLQALSVFSGATATDTIVYASSYLAAVDDGSLLDGAKVYGGSAFVLLGATAENVDVTSGGLLVNDGGFSIDVSLYGGSATVVSGGSDSGTIVDAGGLQYVHSGGTATAAVVGNGGRQAVASGGLVIDTVVSSGGRLYVGSNGMSVSATIGSGGEELDFASGQASDLRLEGGALQDLQDVAYGAGETAVFVGSGTLEVRSGSTVLFSENLAGDYAGDTATVTNDGYDDVLLTIDAPCFAPGTALDTPDGAIRVEDLRVGAVVATLAGPAPVRWIGRRRTTDAVVIRLRAHALGENQPRRDLCVSDDHAIFLDGVLVPAGLLVNGGSIVAERREQITFFHVELATHAILLAEGAPTESYIDTGNRRQFGNCPMNYDPTAATQDHCAELVVAGARLDAIRARLALVPV